MSSDQEEASHMIVVGEGIFRAEESPFLEAEKPATQSLQLMRRLKSWKLSHIVNFKASGSMTMSVSSVTQLCPSLRPPWTVVCQASLSITNSQSLLKLMSIELVMPSNHLILCLPLLLPPSIFPSIRVFSNKSVLCIRWPKYYLCTNTVCHRDSPFFLRTVRALIKAMGKTLNQLSCFLS